MFRSLIAYIKSLFAKKQTCAECGEPMKEDDIVHVNNAEDVCANCYAREMM